MSRWKRQSSRYNLNKKFCLISITNLMHKLFYFISICMLHYNPRHVSSINMPIFRGTICIITASGIVTLCKRLYSMPDESRLLCSLLSSGVLYCTVLYREFVLMEILLHCTSFIKLSGLLFRNIFDYRWAIFTFTKVL
jgi:hypothetical protein